MSNITKNLIKCTGVILKESNYNEFDKLISILTREYGKISVYAFNVRRSNSTNIGKIRLFTFAEFELKISNNKYSLCNSKIVKNFDCLSKNYDNVRYASYFIQLVDYFSMENSDTKEICELLYFSFKALCDEKIDKRLIRRIFELKLMYYEGIYKQEVNTYYDIDKKHIDTLQYTWNFILNNKNNKLFSFKLDYDILYLFEKEMDKELNEKINIKFNNNL